MRITKRMLTLAVAVLALAPSAQAAKDRLTTGKSTTQDKMRLTIFPATLSQEALFETVADMIKMDKAKLMTNLEPDPYPTRTSVLTDGHRHFLSVHLENDRVTAINNGLSMIHEIPPDGKLFPAPDRGIHGIIQQLLILEGLETLKIISGEKLLDADTTEKEMRRIHQLAAALFDGTPLESAQSRPR